MTNKFQNPKTKIITIVAAVFLIGILIGMAGSVKANVFGDFYNKYLKPLFNGEKNATSTLEITKEIYSPTVDYEQAIIKAVEGASPAVVSIIISKDVPIIEQCPYNPFSDLPEEFQQFFGGSMQFYAPCQKGTQKQEIGGGSGFIVTSDGLIVTNKHVVSDAEASYTVFTNDGKKYDAKVLAKHPNLDLAIVKINASGLETVKLGNSSGLKLGQTTIAIGNALGEFRNTVSIGVISGLSRSVTAYGGSQGSEQLNDLIQTDAAINSGNSGGPLLNLKGEVIGINVAMVSGAQSIGFAVPIDQVKKSIESAKTSGKISVPFLGVRYFIINEEVAKKEKLSVDYGILIRGDQDGPAVVKNSPAEKAGLEAEDIILEFNGEKITQDNSLGTLIQKYNVGDKITLKILRVNKELNVEITLSERPNE